MPNQVVASQSSCRNTGRRAFAAAHFHEFADLITVLRLEKFHPVAAENGRVGVELAKKEKPDLILCDVMMPELDGYGVLAALRADAETVAMPFIFLTAKGEKPEIRAGMNLGA